MMSKITSGVSPTTAGNRNNFNIQIGKILYFSKKNIKIFECKIFEINKK